MKWDSCPHYNDRKVVLGMTYRSERIVHRKPWLEGFETMLTNLSAHWDGLLVITGDFDIDVLKSDAALPMQYTDILSMYNLPPVATKSTRITAKSKNLIYHFITNYANREHTSQPIWTVIEVHLELTTLLWIDWICRYWRWQRPTNEWNIRCWWPRWEIRNVPRNAIRLPGKTCPFEGC